MTKYVKLSSDHTEFRSAIHSVKPRQIARLDDAVIHHYDWFVVREEFPLQPKNENIYQLTRDSWSVVDDEVVVVMTYEKRPVNSRREYIRDRINAILNQKLADPVWFEGKPFDRDAKAMIRITGATLRAITDPTHVQNWVTADNETISLTAQQITNLGLAQASKESELVLYARRLKDTALIMDNPEDLDIITGWPDTHYTSEDF